MRFSMLPLTGNVRCLGMYPDQSDWFGEKKLILYLGSPGLLKSFPYRSHVTGDQAEVEQGESV